MFLTFTKNEFINKFNEEGFGNTPPPASISKLISRFHVYRVFEEIWASQQSGYYARFNNTLVTLVAFNHEMSFKDAHIIEDFFKQVDGVYGEFFFSSVKSSSPVHFIQWSLEPHPRLLPSVDDWKRVVQLEDGLFFDDNQHHRLTGVPWSKKYSHATNDVDDNTSCYKYVVCRHPTDTNVSWALASGCCLIIHSSSRLNWFTHFLVPFVHYFPTDENTQSVIKWLTENDAAAKRVADNGFEIYQRHLTKHAVINALQSTLRRSNYACPLFKFKVNPLPPPEFSVSWCGSEPDVDNVVSIKRLNFVQRQACLIQTMVLFQYLQWHYAAYLSRFKIIITDVPSRFETRDVDDHFFNMSHTIYILIQGPVYYIDPISQRTNYQEILHNYQDILKVFGFEEELQCDKTSSFKECLNHFYHKTRQWLPQNVYSRRYPTPMAKLGSLTKVMTHPLPFDNNTNKLVIYRQYQLYLPALTPEYRLAFHKILKNKRRDDLTFDIVDFESYDWWRLQYDESVSIPHINVANDASHQRLLLELIKVVSPIDKPYYLKLFEPLMNLDKVIYSIRYAQLKTISVEQ